MKSLPIVVLCVPLLLAGCGSSASSGDPATSTTASATTPAVDETPAIRAAFDTYTKSALAKDGTTAQGVLADTIATYYDDARKAALTGTDEQVSALPTSQRLTVYVLRGEIDPAVLRDSTPADLVKAAIDQGLVGEQGISKLSLGKVDVTGDKASAEVASDGQKAPFKMQFIKESGTWKVDIAPLMSLADGAFTEAAKQQGLTVDAMIDSILVSKYGQEKADALHQPVGG